MNDVRPPVLVIGWGNDLRGDDGAGRDVARALAANPPPGTECLEAHQLVPELAPELAGRRRVIFVDACRETASAPVVSRLNPAGAAGRAPGPGHAGGPGGLLAVASLFGPPPADAWLVAVPGTDFDIGEHRSPAGRAAADAAAGAVRRLAATA